MSPTVRHDAPPVDLDVVRGHRPPRSARCYAWFLLVAAVALVGALVAAGHAWPAAGPLLVLAIPLALCMNRYLLFPDELGVAADAAVLFAAMVVFRADAPWTGPLVVALLVGPLDARHWGARAWTRMAYNSGSTALTAAAALAVSVPLSPVLGSGGDATLGAAAVAALAYVAVESALGIGLVTLLGEQVSTAARHQLPLNAIGFPLAVLGAAAGLAWVDVGWWLGLAVLLPVPLAPELVYVVAPRRWGRARVAVVAGCIVLLVALALPGVPSVTTVLVGCAVLAGAESRVARYRVPILGVAVAVATVFVATGTARWFTVTAVVAIACVVGWSTTTAAPAGSVWSRAAWCCPELAAAGFAATLWRGWDGPGPVVFVASSLVVLVVAAAWGAPPWGSRFVGHWADRRVGARRRAALLAVAVAAVGAAVVAVVSSTTRWDAVLVAGLCAEAALAGSASAVRQWRFAPRRRVGDGAVVTVTAVLVAALPALLGEQAIGAQAITIALAAAIAVAVAWRLDPSRFGPVSSQPATGARAPASSPGE